MNGSRAHAEIGPFRTVAIATAAGIVNMLLGAIVHTLQLPLYLDSILTVIVTLHLGFVPGAITAVVTNGLLALSGQVLFPFVICNLITAGITWAFAKKRWLRSPTGFMWLGLAIAFANGFVGSVLAYIIYSGVTTVHGIDRLVMGLVVTGQSLLTAVFWSGMITNLVDKVASAMLAYVSRRWVSERLRLSRPRAHAHEQT